MQAEYVDRIFSKMTELADSENIIKSYRDDLEIDHKFLNSAPTERFVWIMKSAGTVLFPLDLGFHPCWIDHPLDSEGMCYDHTAQAFLVTAYGVRPITNDKAIELANTEPNLPVAAANSLEFCNKITEFLEKTRPYRGTFTKINIPAENWQAWLDHFRMEKNLVMMRFLSKALSKASKQTGIYSA